MDDKKEALEQHIKNEMSRIDARIQHDADDTAVWENERAKLNSE